MENLHEKNYSDLKNLRGDNEYREQENQQLEKDMGTLEEHLVMLEKQNSELDRELKDIVTGDETIKSRLRSRSPKKDQLEISSGSATN